MKESSTCKKYKVRFLKLKFKLTRGSKKEKIILKIISVENYLKQFIYKYLLSKNKTQGIDGNQTYVFDNIVFQAGDVFIDIGANTALFCK